MGFPTFAATSLPSYAGGRCRGVVPMDVRGAKVGLQLRLRVREEQRAAGEELRAVHPEDVSAGQGLPELRRRVPPEDEPAAAHFKGRLVVLQVGSRVRWMVLDPEALNGVLQSDEATSGGRTPQMTASPIACTGAYANLEELTQNESRIRGGSGCGARQSPRNDAERVEREEVAGETVHLCVRASARLN